MTRVVVAGLLETYIGEATAVASFRGRLVGDLGAARARGDGRMRAFLDGEG